MESMTETRGYCPYPRCIARGMPCQSCRDGTRFPWDEREKARKNGFGRGRPTSEALAIAKMLGDKTYHGSACKVCEGTERYVKNSSCVECGRRRTVEGTRLRKAAGTALAQMDVCQKSGNETNELEAISYGTSSVPEIDNDLNDLLGTGTAQHVFPYDRIEKNISHGLARSSVPTRKSADSTSGSNGLAGTRPSVPTNKPQLSPRRVTPDRALITRYFAHPESGSLFTTAGEDPASDGLVEEIDRDQFEYLQTDGYTVSGEIPVDRDQPASYGGEDSDSNPWD